MNYRHAFHAGNFADVHKHVVLYLLLQYLHKKPAPFFVIDTHAGRGRYDLRSAEAERGAEWRHGIARLRAQSAVAKPIENYLALTASTAQTYCGSPLIIAAMVREHDRAVFVEREPEEAAALKNALGRRKRIAVLNEDGYAALKAHVPPKENRGLVLIDPPYERDSEFADAATALQSMIARWPNGVYALWYPIKAGGAEHRLYESLRAAHIKKVLAIEFNVRPQDSPLGLNGSGLVVVNPPWQLDEELRPLLGELHRIVAPDAAGGVRIEWLARE